MFVKVRTKSTHFDQKSLVCVDMDHIYALRKSFQKQIMQG